MNIWFRLGRAVKASHEEKLSPARIAPCLVQVSVPARIATAFDLVVDEFYYSFSP